MLDVPRHIKRVVSSMLSVPFCNIALVLTIVLFVCVTVACAAEEPLAVTVKAEPYVQDGKLKVRYSDDQAKDEALKALYGSLAGTFKKRVLDEVNASLNSLNPIVEWKAPVGAGREKTDVKSLIKTENVSAAKQFSGPLKEWLQNFLVDTKEAGKFFQWFPTRLITVEEEAGKVIDEDEISTVLSHSTTTLIGKINQSEVAQTNYLTPILKVYFNRALRVKRVNLVGMDFPPELHHIERVEFSNYRKQKKDFEDELSAAATGLALAWNDDVAVQRMMVVLRARGMWNEFAQADPGAPRAIHWLSFRKINEREVEADVHLPHLCYIRFESGADSDSLISAVTKILLSPEEWNVIQKSIDVQRGTVKDDQFLKNVIVSIPDSGKYVDLFSLASYRGFQESGKNGVRFPPFPIKETWMAPRREQIRDMGWFISEGPVVKDENRLVDSRNTKRSANLNGGVEISISPPRPKDTNDGASNGGSKDNSLKHWAMHTVKYRAEAGGRVEDTQRVYFFGGVSASHSATFGTLSTELAYQYRFSAKIDWEPPNSEDTLLLPSTLSVFTESAARRKVTGQEIEIQRNGFRISKQKTFKSLDVTPRLDAGLELSHVHDFAGSLPNSDEFRAPLAFSLFSEPNHWDARQYWSVRASATPSARWSTNEIWCLAGAAGQFRYPRGLWDYFASFDARWAVGSAPPDALPYTGGVDGVRGVRPYGVPAKARFVVRNELWRQAPFIGRSTGSDQRWYGLAYESLRLAGFVDLGWASRIQEEEPTAPWFISPGVGVRIILARATHLNLDYAYGFTNPSSLGKHRFSLGITTQF